MTAIETRAAPPGPLREFWHYFSENSGAVAGLIIIVAVTILAVLAPVVAPHSPNLTNSTAFLRPPVWQQGGSWTYPLGTDAIGRDMLSRLIYGARLSLLIGISVVAISIVVGTVLGLVAGFFRGIVEIVIMRIMDIILTLPSLLLAIVIVAILGPGLMNAMLAVAVVVLPHYVRATRAAVISKCRARLCHSGESRWRWQIAADVQGGAAELHRALDRAGFARHLDRDPRCRGAQLSRPRSATALGRSGARCWRTHANSCCAPGGW